MMNRTITVASRLASVTTHKTSTSWKSSILQQQPRRTFLSPTPFVNAAAATAPEEAAPKTTKKKAKKTDDDKEGKANKNTMIIDIAAKHEISQAEAGRIIDTVTELITGALKDKKEVTIAGFGKFRSVVQKARVARNPGNGEKVNVPEKNRVSFTAYTSLKEAVNESTAKK